jgi:hypothetical protein
MQHSQSRQKFLFIYNYCWTLATAYAKKMIKRMGNMHGKTGEDARVWGVKIRR